MSWKSEIPSERNSFSLSWPLLYERWQRLTFYDVNVTREYCSVYLIDDNKHTVSLVMQARVGVGMKLFTYLFLFSQFSNIQNVQFIQHETFWFGRIFFIHCTTNGWYLVSKKINAFFRNYQLIYTACDLLKTKKINSWGGWLEGEIGGHS